MRWVCHRENSLYSTATWTRIHNTHVLKPTDPPQRSLFRWFQRTFPGVVRKPDKRGSTDECDNLYIDANSIVHNACHPNDRVNQLIDASEHVSGVGP